MPAKILKCNCTNEYQDQRYGYGNRVHTQMIKNEGSYFRCTVCSTERSGTKEIKVTKK